MGKKEGDNSSISRRYSFEQDSVALKEQNRDRALVVFFLRAGVKEGKTALCSMCGTRVKPQTPSQALVRTTDALVIKGGETKSKK